MLIHCSLPHTLTPSHSLLPAALITMKLSKNFKWNFDLEPYHFRGRRISRKALPRTQPETIPLNGDLESTNDTLLPRFAYGSPLRRRIPSCAPGGKDHPGAVVQLEKDSLGRGSACSLPNKTRFQGFRSEFLAIRVAHFDAPESQIPLAVFGID